eukprot:356329-Chlamydomonas_euryale.AAC.1
MARGEAGAVASWLCFTPHTIPARRAQHGEGGSWRCGLLAVLHTPHHPCATCSTWRGGKLAGWPLGRASYPTPSLRDEPRQNLNTQPSDIHRCGRCVPHPQPSAITRPSPSSCKPRPCH